MSNRTFLIVAAGTVTVQILCCRYIDPTPNPWSRERDEFMKMLSDAEKEWRNPANEDEEVLAVLVLSGTNAIGSTPPFPVPDRLTELFIERRLNYRFPESRRMALTRLVYLFDWDLNRVIALVQDGLDDPHPTVRHKALLILSEFWAFPCHWETRADGVFGPPFSDEQLDEIVELLASKALVDDDKKVRACGALYFDSSRIEPTCYRLQLLERACRESRRRQQITATEEQQILGPWRVAVHGGVFPPPEDPKLPAPPLDPNIADPFAEPPSRNSR